MKTTQRLAIGNFIIGLSAFARHAPAQANVLDLRVVEVNETRDVTYQNFIYARSFAGGKLLAQALYLRLPQFDYNEVAIAPGVRAITRGQVNVYALAGIASATEAAYFEPAVLAQDLSGRLTGTLYLQRYMPLESGGVGQWLLDTFEMQYVVHDPVFVGGAFYAYRPDGGAWLTKLGPKVGFADKFGSTEIRIAHVNAGGGTEFQLRRIVVF